MFGWLADIAPAAVDFGEALLDPLNITGIQNNGGGPSSAAPVQHQQVTGWQAPTHITGNAFNAIARPDVGYMASMLPRHGGFQQPTGMLGHQQAPTPGWNYVPGKGPVYQQQEFSGFAGRPASWTNNAANFTPSSKPPTGNRI